MNKGMKKRTPSNCQRLASFALSAASLSFLSLSACADVTFLGIASGDASSTDAVVWTRAVDTNAPAATDLIAQVAANDPSVTIGVVSFPVTTDPARDYTAKVVASNLLPGTKYYYRFVNAANAANASITGTFKTAPDPAAAASVRFAFSGDCDGLMRPYALASLFPSQNLDFFVFLGDTIDVNTGPDFMNKALGFETLQQVYLNYQPVRERGFIATGMDARTDGTPLLFFAQRWGQNAIFINADDRTYRDIRMKTAANADDTGVRAANANRTMLGATQLGWLKQTLLDAEAAGVPWKIIAISSPIDQLGPIGGALAGVTNGGNTGYVPVASDGGKSWMGQYRVERNALLKFIADHHIYNVVFLSTDDHQNRINELTYSPTGLTEDQSSYVRVPHCLEIVDGPLGATGPELVTNHTFANNKLIADSIAAAQTAAGIDPLGLDPSYPGLHNVTRENDPMADSVRQPVDFYSPDTFN